MNVELFNFSKRFNSTKAPTAGSGTSFTNVQLKDDTSIYAPVLLFAVSSFSVPTIAPTLYNYASIAKFQRNYFIEDWTYRGNVWEAQLTIDVLGTYKTSIGNVSTLIERSASQFDSYVTDKMYPISGWSNFLSINCNSPFYNKTMSSGTFIVGIVGTATASFHNTVGSVNYWALDMTAMQSLCSYLFSNSIYTSSSITDISEGLYKSLFNPLQYIVSCIWYPLDISLFNGQGLQYMNIGYWTSNVSAYPCNTYFVEQTLTAFVPNHPQIARGNYLNLPPYTKATLYAPVFGAVSLDCNFRSYGLWVKPVILIDVVSGMATMRVWMGDTTSNPADLYITCERTGQFGVSIQLAQTIESIISQGLSLGTYGEFIHGMANVIGSALYNSSAYNYQAGTPSISTTGANSSLLVTMLQAYITVEYSMLTDEDQADIGRPLMKVKTINTLSGYVKCVDAHIDLPVTDKEKKSITEFMNTGFFYE